MTLNNPTVSIFKLDDASYPSEAPYHPSERYPEYIFGSVTAGSFNGVYHAVRETLAMLQLDLERFGHPDWNPFGKLIVPGNTVVIKPNAVWDINLKRNETVFASITHGSVLRVVIDYVYKAINGQGRILIADAPIAHSDFERWKHITGMESLAKFYREKVGFTVEIYDLRQLYAPWDHQRSFAPVASRQYSNRDPAGYVEVDMGDSSEFSTLSESQCRLLYGSDYNRRHTVQHHINGHHQYCVAKSFLNADVVISIPKLKVHSKVGTTLNIKSMVGTQGDKNYVPHHRIGDPSRGGDEYPDQGKFQNSLNRYRMWLLTNVLAHQNRFADLVYQLLFPLYKLGQRIADKICYMRYGAGYEGHIAGGSWYGNDTAWRMALDLIHIILYADRDGRLYSKSRRQFFSIVDGVIGGEGNGPLAPSAKPCGVILGGFNPLAVDIVATRLMGFDPLKIKLLHEGLRRPFLNDWSGDQQDIQIVSNSMPLKSLFNSSERFLFFIPPKGWHRHIEIDGSGESDNVV